MNDLYATIQDRRSIRTMERRPIADEDLAKVLEAVRWAPSWANTQCWEVVVATDPQVKTALQETLAGSKNPAARAMLDAPVVLVICARKDISGFYKGEAATRFGDWMMFRQQIAEVQPHFEMLGNSSENECDYQHD